MTTMLIASSQETAQRHFNCAAAAGQAYGLELNLDKTILMTIRGGGQILGTDGKPLTKRDGAVYLGGLLSTDGRPVAELTRRIGETRQMSYKLTAVWKHANISRQRKKHILDSCVVSKLLYGLESVWLLQADRSKLDAFYASGLRKILNVAPSFISQVPNATVMDYFDAKPLSHQLLARQLHLYGKLCHRTQEDLKRQVALEPNDRIPRSWHPNRRVGRPCLRWTDCVFAEALQICEGSVTKFQNILSNPKHNAWKQYVNSQLMG